MSRLSRSPSSRWSTRRRRSRRRRPSRRWTCWRSASASRPSEIKTTAGTTLQIRLESDDTAHGFRIIGTDVNIEIPKRGRGTTTVTFKAEKAGRYTFECSQLCGAGHSFMRGVIVVADAATAMRAAWLLVAGAVCAAALVARAQSRAGAAGRSAAGRDAGGVRGVPARRWTTSWKSKPPTRVWARPSTARAAPRATTCPRSAASARSPKCEPGTAAPTGTFRPAARCRGDTLFHLFSIPTHSCQPVIPPEANVIARRVPVPVFGAGLIEAIEDHDHPASARTRRTATATA